MNCNEHLAQREPAAKDLFGSAQSADPRRYCARFPPAELFAAAKKYRAGRETIIEYITTGVKPAPVLIKNKSTIRET